AASCPRPAPQFAPTPTLRAPVPTLHFPRRYNAETALLPESHIQFRAAIGLGPSHSRNSHSQKFPLHSLSISDLPTSTASSFRFHSARATPAFHPSQFPAKSRKEPAPATYQELCIQHCETRW